MKQQRIAILYRAGVGALAAVLFVVSTISGWAASPPNIITYQGRLLDSNGVPVTSASISMVFELYTDPTAGSCVWSNSSASCATATSRTVTLTDGLFSESLGDTTLASPYAAIGDSIFADNAALYLKVTVGGEALSPRKQLTSSPYALNSETLDGLNSSNAGGTSAFVPVTGSTGNLTLTGTPSGTGIGAGSLYVNPASVTAGHTIFGVANNTTEVFRVASNAVYITPSLTIGGTTTFASNAIDSTSALSINTTNNQAINTGTGALTTGGDLSVTGAFFANDYVRLGNSVDDTIFVTGTIQGATPFVFEGLTANAYETMFALPNPTTSDNTITFQNGSGTLAFTSDIPSGASLWEVGTNGTYEDDAAVIVGSDAAFSYVSTAAASDLRVGDDFEAVDDGFFGGDLVVGASISATETISHSGFSLSGNDLFIADSLGIEGALFTDGGFTQGDADADSVTFYGNAIGFAGSAPILNSASAALGINTTNNQAINTGTGLLTVGGNLTVNGTAVTLVGNSTVVDMTGTGTLGLNTTTNRNIATGTGTFDIGGHLAVGGNASISTKQILTVQENIDCSTGCYGVYVPVTNSAGSMAADSYGGDFRLTSAVGPSVNLSQIGLSGVAIPSGAVTYSGTVTGVQGQIAATAAATLTDVYGVRGLVSLNSLSNVTTRAAGLSSAITSSNSGTFTGVIDAVFGNFSPTAGTYSEVNGIDLNIEGASGTVMNTARGILVNLDPVAGIFNSSNTHSGAQITIDGDNGSGNDASVYGANITATSSTTGTTSAYGVRATASGADTNYSGYFYGSMFQVDADATPDTNNTLASGAGDLYVIGDVEADGNMRVDGGLIRLAGTGDILFDAATSGTDKYSGLSLVAADGGGTGGDWQMYTLGGATIMGGNGTASDLRWTTEGDYNNNSDVMRLTSAGALLIDSAMTASAYNTAAGQADLAEVYEVADQTLAAGEIVSVNSSGEIVRALSVEGLLGVVSTSPGYLLNGSVDELSADERMIALAGRVPVKVNLENGEIAAGDSITISSSAGEGMKASGVGEIIGFALESYVGGGAPIEVLINLQWHSAGKIYADGSGVGMNSNLIINSLSDATASNTTVDSESLTLRGSAFDVVASGRDFSLNTVVSSATDYRLSIKNVSDSEVAYINQDGAFSIAGDMIVGGHLYPSDRGVAQTNRYIFYDGSAGPGGDFMRTNASGWATGSYDFAEMFPSDDDLEPGDVVVFGDKKESVVRSSSKNSLKIAGVVSTRPGFLAGENKQGNYPIALAGRVPTKVSNEGGDIKIGDALTTSSTHGVAMKTDGEGMILGYALEDFSGANGNVMAFINVTYWNGLDSDAQPKNLASGVGGASLSGLDVSGTVYIGANDILNVGSISGMNLRWEIAENGDFKTRGIITTAVEAYNGDIVETHAVTSPEIYITMVGTVELENGKASVNLVDENPEFNAVVSNMVPLRVVATPHEPISVYVANKTSSSFDVVQINGAMNGVEVDWYVVGVRKDFEPEEYLELEENVDTTEEVEVSDEPLGEQPAVETIPEPSVEPEQEETPVSEEVIEVVEVVEVEEEPASDVSASPEPEQIAVETPNEETPQYAEPPQTEVVAE